MSYFGGKDMICNFTRALNSGEDVTLMSMNHDGIVYLIEGNLVASDISSLAIRVRDSDTVLSIGDERLLGLRLGYGHGNEMMESWERHLATLTSDTSLSHP